MKILVNSQLLPLMAVASLSLSLVTLHAQDTFSETADGLAATELDQNTAAEAGVFFTPTADLKLTGLGAWAGSFTTTNLSAQNVTTEDLEVGLYDVTDNEFLFYATVNSGTIENSQGFAYAPLPAADADYTLTAGTEYEVVDFGGPYGENVNAYRGTDNPTATPYKRDRVPGYGKDEILLQAGPDITLDGYDDTNGAINPGTQTAIFPSSYPPLSIEPNTSDSPLDTSVVGPNIEYDVIPEPTTLADLALAGAGLVFLVRRKVLLRA